MKTYYFDHAASSWPKPETVIAAMTTCLHEYAANPGRGSHQMAVRASRTVFEARNSIAELFHISNANDICFSLNTTESLNLAIKGLLKPHDHVISTSIEHNSVRRPLEYLLHTQQVDTTYVCSDPAGHLSLQAVKEAIRNNTRLLICTHSSNLMGTIAPIADMAELCRQHNLVFLVDAAQTAGTIPINVERMGIHMLAFPGHKGLLGPQGTGGLYIHPDINLEPLIHGGTGSLSEQIEQPFLRPDRYESGTQNTVGLAGLNEGVKFIQRATVEHIMVQEWEKTQQLMEGLMSVEGITLLGPNPQEHRTGIVSFLLKDKEAAELAYLLDKNYGIAVRAGFHCTPLAHETAGTMSTGAVRASIGYFTTKQEIEYFIEAMHQISREIN